MVETARRAEPEERTMHPFTAATPGGTGSVDDQLSVQLLHQRIIVLGSEVDDPIANRICGQLLLLSAEDPLSTINLYINSPGGSVTAGLAIYDTMRLIPNDVSTLALGLAGSMGQFLLTAGTPGKRYALPHAQILMRLTAEHTGQPIDTVERDSRRDRWFTAEEALEYGLIDRVLDSVDDVRPEMARQPMGLGA
jgi:ATP-dependent Clp protease protease subunit